MVAVLLAAPAPGQPLPGILDAEGYTVFVQGTPIGRESVSVTSDGAGTVISSQGRFTSPLNFTIRRAEFRYGPDWTPLSFELEADQAGSSLELRTSFAGGTARTEGARGDSPIATSHQVDPMAVIHVNGIVGSYVALGRRLMAAGERDEFPVYVVGQAQIPARIVAVHDERMQLGTSFLDVRRYEIAFANPGGDLLADLTVDHDGELIRISIPSQTLDVVREDIASTTSRTQVFSNPGDEAVVIPAAGFSLGATLTWPEGGRTSPPEDGLPAVILLAGSGVGERDGYVYGVPTIGQLAGAVAEAGFLAVRYDKRGYGQSGGRAESATLDDYASDVRDVVRWLRRRDDVDGDKVAVVGHSEGAWVALRAASREGRIRAVVALAAPSTTGAELVLEQQARALDALDLSPEEREARVALQRRIHEAVLGEESWEGIPDALRLEADTPWFRSLLAFDPVDVLDDVDQPILFVQGELDRQVPVEHGRRLEAMAREADESDSIELVVVPGVNHLLVPARTGEVSEYGTLTDRDVSEGVRTATTQWLARTFAAIR